MLKFLFPFAWIGAWIFASAIYRRTQGKPIIPRTPPDAVFHEAWCSGRSLRNWLTRVGGARNCLMVYVQGRELVVTPHFPFSLMFLPEIYGLDVRVPIAAITEVEQIDGLIGRCLRIGFVDGTPTLELRVRDETGLVHHLGKTRANDETEMGPSRKLRKNFRLTVFRVFAAIWGSGALIGAFSGLPEDYRFRRDGVEVVGVIDRFDNAANTSKPQAILSYSVGDRRYHLSPVFGSDAKIGDTKSLFYLPTDPGQSRDAAFLVFDLGALGLGLLALTASILGGRIARRLS